MPGSVMRCRGRVGSGSSLRRSWFMYWRKVMGLGEVARPPHRPQELTLANELAGVTRQHPQHLPFGRRQVQGLGGADGLFPCHCWAANRCKAHARINAAFALTRSLVSVSTMRASCSVLNRSGRRSRRTDAVRDDVQRLDGGGLLGGVKQTEIDLLAMVGKLRPPTAADRSTPRMPQRLLHYPRDCHRG